MSYFQDLTARIVALPAHGIGALLILLLYAIQSEIRFGAKLAATHGSVRPSQHS